MESSTRMAILTNLDLLRDPLDPVLFPGAPAGATAHSGFQEQHAMTAMPILEEVKRLLAATGSRSVTLVSYSILNLSKPQMLTTGIT